ncbi:hypothetical protein AHF37_05942, partial [Paragonimus kellicotti]
EVVEPIVESLHLTLHVIDFNARPRQLAERLNSLGICEIKAHIFNTELTTGMTIQRTWRYVKNSENFDMLVHLQSIYQYFSIYQPITNTKQLPSNAAFEIQVDQLAYCWSHTFESHRCSIQHPAERAINYKTVKNIIQHYILKSYSELFDKIGIAVARRTAPWSRITDLNVKLTSWEVSVETHKLEGYSVFEVLKYFPGRLSDDRTKLFLLFQVVDHVCGLHRQCLPHLGLGLQNIFIDGTFFLTLGIPDLGALSDFRPPESSSKIGATPSIFKETDLFVMTLQWCSRKIKSLDYLMFLNGLAGRRLGDPLNSTLRDLTKSKYHLSKGEAQLDANYKVPISETLVSDGLLRGHMLPSISECGTNVTELVETMGNIIKEPPTACLRDDDNIISGREDTGSTSQLDVEKSLPIETWSPLSFQPHHLLDMMPNIAYYTYMAASNSHYSIYLWTGVFVHITTVLVFTQFLDRLDGHQNPPSCVLSDPFIDHTNLLPV